MRNISRRGIISVIVFLIVGIILISFGVLVSVPVNFDTFSDLGMIGFYLMISGGVITGLDIIGGIYLVVKSRRK